MYILIMDYTIYLKNFDEAVDISDESKYLLASHTNKIMFSSLTLPVSEMNSLCLSILSKEYQMSNVALDPFSIEQSLIIALSDQYLRNAPRERLKTELMAADILSQYDSQELYVSEDRLVSIVCSTSEVEHIYQTILSKITPIIIKWFNFDRIEKILRRKLKVQNWNVERVVLGTQKDSRYKTNKIDLQNAFCHNFLDEDLTAHDLNVFTLSASKNDWFRVFAGQSIIYPNQFYIQVEVPLTYYMRSSNGRKVGHTNHFSCFQLEIVGKNDPFLPLMKNLTIYQPFALPAFNLQNFAKWCVIPFNDIITSTKMHKIGFFLPMMYMRISTDTYHSKVVQLLNWNPFVSSKNPILKAFADIIVELYHKLGSYNKSPLWKVYSSGITCHKRIKKDYDGTPYETNTKLFEFDNGVFTSPKHAFFKNVLHVYHKLLFALITSYSTKHSNVTFISPSTIEND